MNAKRKKTNLFDSKETCADNVSITEKRRKKINNYFLLRLKTENFSAH